jgi:hypothetical protein
MTEIEKTEGEIKVLQAKLELLKEMEKHKTPIEEAFKRIYGYYPGVCERSVWIAFQKGYEAAQKDYKVEEYQPTPQEPEEKEQKWDVEKLQEKNWYVDAKDLIESGTALPEPTSTVFRQKLFDGIKSVFYDPDYERTHWKMKVDMAVDEVLTHFYDVIPEEQSAAGSQNVDVEFLVDGYNDCLNEIKSKLR